MTTTRVEVDEAASRIGVLDGDALLSPQTLEKIARAVLRLVEERQEHGRRVRAELSLGGARDDLEGGRA